MLARATEAVARRAEARNEVVVEELVDDVAEATVVANLKLLAVEVLVFLLVAVLLLFLVVVFVVADLQVGAAVDLRDAVFDGLGAEGGVFAGGQKAVRIMPV